MAKRAVMVLVGSDSLLGREIRDIVATSAPEIDLRLIAADEEEHGILTRVGDEPAIVEELVADSLAGARSLLLAGSTESNRKALGLAEESTAVVDLTYATEERSDARLRAPLVESEPPEDATALHVIAHPAAVALALFMRRIQAHDPIRRSVIQIFAPASEFGAAGVEELQQQTVSLLSFKPLPQTIFDTQLAFNLLASYGGEAPQSLEESELRIERHLASLLALPGEGEGAPMPSLRLVQAPVFHGYSFSAWVEFHSSPGLEAMESALAFAPIDVRGADFEPPTNVSQAGETGITVGRIEPDRNEPEAFWFWLVADNLRLTADNAVAVARQLV
ncbi:MAG TPA: Asd/ArgC dimerization domain-containing protein [Bryobacteraceae bacterium]|nr:Asd/ArgC dimerization domain-containing protein [Bryobacteraceae bacterium]